METLTPSRCLACAKFDRRRPVFRPPKSWFQTLSDLFDEYGATAGGACALLGLGPDHLHLYVETDGKRSIEAICRKLKKTSSQEILSRFPELRPRLARGGRIWDQAQFLETVG